MTHQGSMAPARKYHIAYFIGTRPEVIRSAQTLRLLAATDDIELSIINSGQHYDDNMMGAFLRELRVPDVSVNLAVGSADDPEQVGSVLLGTAGVLANLKPSCLCVFGDTNSSLGAALAAATRSVPLVHIEAGCRSNDMTIREEVNRRLIDHASGLLLAVSDHCVANLKQESVPGIVRRVGDPLFDMFVESFVAGRPRGDRGVLTLHRAENADDAARLRTILLDLSEAHRRTGIQWTFPVHPRTAHSLPSGLPKGISLVEPVSYSEMLGMLGDARICVTDSGGLQKEALWARVPCVTVRTSTEWTETVSQGANTLAQPGAGLVDAVVRGLDEAESRDFSDPYGSGRSAEEIGEAVVSWLREGARFRVAPAGLAALSG